MNGLDAVKCQTMGFLRRAVLGVVFTGLLLVAAGAHGAELTDSGRLRIFDESPKLIVVNGYSTSFQWPELLKQKIDRFTGGQPRIDVRFATAGGTPVAGWMDVETGVPKKVWAARLTPVLKGKGSGELSCWPSSHFRGVMVTVTRVSGMRRMTTELRVGLRFWQSMRSC